MCREVSIAVFLVLAGSLNGQDSSTPAGEPSRPRIVREPAEVNPLRDILIEKRLGEDGLETASFRVSGSIFDRGYPSDDPFSPSETKVEPKKVLEDWKITFAPESRVEFDPLRRILTVTNTPEENAKLLELLKEEAYRPGRNVVARIEIYEMPILLALDVIESAAAFGNHRPERDALVKVTGEGKVRLVNALRAVATSGERVRVEDVRQMLTHVKSVAEGDSGRESVTARMENIGTAFEVDPVLGADDTTISLNLVLVHDTAEPRAGERTMVDGEGPRQVWVSVFHRHQIDTMVTILGGSYQLIGSWKPTGEERYETGKLMHLAFVHAHVSPSHDFE